MSSNPDQWQLTASCPRGLADLLAAELESFGAVEVRERSSGVACVGSLEVAYRACLGSRLANRILLEISSFEAADASEFYDEAHALDWVRHVGRGATLACDFSGRHPTITHTHFGALKLKDAVCDRLREATGSRPDVQPERPSVRVHAHATGTRIVLSIDLSGESLHRRGYRAGAGEAPLKENVAAGMLLRAGWRELAARGGEFLDPLCGSGTLVIEAAMIAAEIAPGLRREHFGFLGWRGHDAELWARVRQEAEERARLGHEQAKGLILRGTDRDARVIQTARRNAERAGVEELVQFETGALADARPLRTVDPADAGPADRVAAGLLATNPPYGVRLEDRDAARAVHRELGAVLRERFEGWDAAVLTGVPELGRELGIRAHRTHTLWNGAIECRLLRMKVTPESLREPGRLARPGAMVAEGPGARMFANRLAKNLKRIGTWAKRSGVSCYRMYDADMPEYAFAIDRYEEEGPGPIWLYVQEYAAPSEIEPDAVRRRRGEVLATLPEATGVAPERIRVRTRRRTKRGEQYVRREEPGEFRIVAEGGLKFEVNFDEYLDTGVFLDHRLIRGRLRDAARGARFLNLFAYTGTATVYAASGGARSTTSVDLSRTYLDWAQRNLALNGLAAGGHALVQADCREWLADRDPAREQFDLILLDPPTFSNSKRMEGVLDVTRDHPALLAACARLLAPGGLILFSTNAQRFRIAESLGELYEIRDISAATIPMDFERNPRIHRAYEVRPRGSRHGSGTAPRP
ncbi:MAG TPA: bifunctional 23S rRNA (guanine(2069)-N(7))-methyltransferase RlmK/23S rRNA (guanine(2445)-N(2))-methyltransferase RlmL [Steroidobacteraceae bacterium]|nr:bifunctional 23S rRNA (guanine(2069)-N(7))-methyltransferase RlmK/23S rRNA (guanine(2445)-N(2))-methyltransferase RlmL [Steroidobacteraceae bacterium]